MSSRNVNQTLCLDNFSELVKHLLYALCGSGSVMTNSIVITAILTHSSLRGKPVFQLICSLAFMDYVEGWSTMMAGVYRTIVRLFGYQVEQYTPYECMVQLPWSYLWRVSDFGTAFMLLALSIDRTLAVFKPLEYISYGRTYSITFILVIYLTSIAFGTATAFYPLKDPSKTTSMLCTTHYISPFSYQASKYLSSTASGLSVIMYIPIAVKLWTHSADMQSMGMNVQQYQMSWTVGISCFCTLFLDTIPRAVGVWGTVYLMETYPTECESWMSHLFHLTKINSMINFYLYWRRSDAIRHGIIDTVDDFKNSRWCFCCRRRRVRRAGPAATAENQRLRRPSSRDVEEALEIE